MSNYVLSLTKKSTTSEVLKEDTSTYSDILLQNDIDNNFNISRAEDVKAIRNSVHNIFCWHPGERILDPEFGLNLRTFLYEGIFENSYNEIGMAIKNVLSKYEPRVTIVDIVNRGNDSTTDNNEIKLEIYYKVNMDADTTYKELVYV